MDNLRCQHQARAPAPPVFWLHKPPRSREEAPGPMQLGRFWLSEKAYQRHAQLHLYFYCGQTSHLINRCAEISSKPQVTIDSGDAVNLIDSKLVRTLCLPTIPCTAPLRITSIDSQPIGGGYLTHQTELLNLQLGLFRQERLAFYITTSPANPLVLGYPWLRCHDPLISWSKRELLRWSPQCTESCFNGIIPRPCLTTTVECLENTIQVTIPWEYNDFREVFSKERATDLPAHHPWDCAIDLNHDAMPPKCHIYLLSIPERKAMEEYNGEVFAMGYIQPSTSPAVGFFFMGKKDDGLCPCIDYGGLNAITVWYPYPLPLVPASLEQLRGGVIFTKLDLRSAYNLIRTSGKLLFTQPVDTMSTWSCPGSLSVPHQQGF
ncbi:hypothetical protein QTP70_001319 [Hemibagrus guttatus]|uniref:Uncharacterized protein n=1 Tax=Hemibagrus guttatus TaxID=175788 RepID=A0AAE0R9E9_9TELE|nr:hypothetical protein QTP70_001319 [Hemibagrus guttatus]